MSRPIEELVRVSPAIWPGQELPVQPGDLGAIAPMGFGLGAPIVVRPWDDPLQALNRPNYYAFQQHEADPIRGAPTTEPAGGTVYFRGDPERTDVDALLRLMGAGPAGTDYAVFVAEAANPPDERFLKQLRIVGHGALRSLFRVGGDGDSFTPQPLTVGELIWAFVEEQQARWGTGMGGALTGALGGDGDWAKESLAFGFLVENGHWGICRVWSRPWLVTK
jgi:hypothetical protein